MKDDNSKDRPEVYYEKLAVCRCKYEDMLAEYKDLIHKQDIVFTVLAVEGDMEGERSRYLCDIARDYAYKMLELSEQFDKFSTQWYN